MRSVAVVTRRTILPGFVADMLDCLAAEGIDPGPVLRAAGLPAEVDGPVTDEDYGRLWRAATAATEDEFVGLGARPMRPGSFALLCHAILHAGTLERALRRALLFLAVVLDDPRGELRVRAGEAEIVLVDRTGPRPAFAYRTYWLVVMGVACWLIGRRIPLRRLDFACPAPAERQDYRQFFGAPARFDCAETRLTFDAAYLASPLIRSEAALKSFLREAPANILVRYRHDQGVSGRIRSELRAGPPSAWPRFEELAARLRLSPATLRRRLGAEGQSFFAIKDELRHAASLVLLREGQRSVADVAAELGYSEPSAFHRAFLKWTGQSPGAYRRAV